MSVRWRKRVKVLPGVHLNFSKGGISTSIGPRGATLNVGKAGASFTGGIPGTGLSARTRLGVGGGSPPSPGPDSMPPHPLDGADERTKATVEGSVAGMVGPWKQSGEWKTLVDLARKGLANGSRQQVYELAGVELRKNGWLKTDGGSEEDRKWAEEVVGPLAFDTVAWQLVSEAVSASGHGGADVSARGVSWIHWALISIVLVGAVSSLLPGSNPVLGMSHMVGMILSGAAGYKSAKHRGFGSFKRVLWAFVGMFAWAMAVALISVALRIAGVVPR